ncbi:MAG TPA: lysylphosphatidylglycerol synthase domain-containing protein [Actinomycetota bacterium]|nr:lysylphosphatidylglycerol synthase domain-containing protein [Actinomycetota bacterium]
MIFTKLAKLLRFRIPMWLAWTAGLTFTAVTVALLQSHLEPGALAETWTAVKSAPAAVAAIGAVYFSAFALRALVWRSIVPGLSFGHALAAIHLAIAGNHVLPLRLGEALRVTSVVKRTKLALAEATASSLTLRAVDALALAGLLVVLGPGLALPRLAGAFGVLALTLIGALGGGLVWMRRLRRRAPEGLRPPGALVAIGSLAAWLLESVVIWQAARWAGIPIDAVDAVLVTAATIFSQVIAVAPGGFGTYEAAAAGMLVALGSRPGPALAAALTAHALKTAYSLLAGGIALVYPSPGLFGRLRLPRRTPAAPTPGMPQPGAPIVFFLPARNEESNVAGVIARMPRTVRGHPVVCLVLDDGSTDRTAEAAERAGAEVVALAPPHGLGAAVRRGLAQGVARNAAAVVFCDADGEYDPAELERLVTPILDGGADYVAGSRFSTGSRRMKPHRMVGNRLLSILLSAVARARISDGQSGYRALSLAAASAAEVVHDYNYAQVLTLDLLSKGFRYAEVPISYRHRTVGTTFVRLLPYLRAVVPAVLRVVNRPQSSTTWAANLPSAASHAAESKPASSSAPAAAQPISSA